VYALSGAADKAIDIYETALRAHPEKCCRDAWARETLRWPGRTAKASMRPKNARKLLPDDPAAAYELGRRRFKLGAIQGDESCCKEAARNSPTNRFQF